MSTIAGKMDISGLHPLQLAGDEGDTKIAGEPTIRIFVFPSSKGAKHGDNNF
jgi:hypothetical protein